jgi:hypothetical protein
MEKAKKQSTKKKKALKAPRTSKTSKASKASRAPQPSGEPREEIDDDIVGFEAVDGDVRPRRLLIGEKPGNLRQREKWFQQRTGGNRK